MTGCIGGNHFTEAKKNAKISLFHRDDKIMIMLQSAYLLVTYGMKLDSCLVLSEPVNSRRL